jgi:hypothetical protein
MKFKIIHFFLLCCLLLAKDQKRLTGYEERKKKELYFQILIGWVLWFANKCTEESIWPSRDEFRSLIGYKTKSTIGAFNNNRHFKAMALDDNIQFRYNNLDKKQESITTLITKWGC